MSFNFDMRTIPHGEHRYLTVGDYITDGFGVIHIRVSNLQDWKYEALVAVHELVEKILVMDKNISEEIIDKFDIEYESTRKEGDFSEPGDDPNAPYHEQHVFATHIERLLAAKLGVNWEQYDKVITELE